MPTKLSAPDVDRSWQAEEDHRTLTRAAEVLSDKDRMKGARKHHRKTGKQLSLVQRTMLGRR